MKARKVSEIMIPLSDYATVSEGDTLATAIKTLSTAKNDPKYKFKHRSVLVYDQGKKIIGKISMFDMIKALEPKYHHFENSENIGSISPVTIRTQPGVS